MFVFHVQHSRISTGIYTHIFAIDSNQVEAYVRTLSTICQPTNQPTAKKVQIFQNEKKKMIKTHTRTEHRILEPISNHMTDSTFSIEHQSQSDTWNAHKIFSADK